MDKIHKVVQQAHECCLPYLEKYGQSALHTVKTFPPAESYADYANQEKELLALLDLFGACIHIRKAAISAHRCLCGNEKHRATIKSASYCNMYPEDFEAMMNDL